MKVLAVIPARGGSKLVPLKNIKDLSGKPLLYYAIKSAQESKLISKVVVSTDSHKIASLARDYNCQVIIRPKDLATDTAATEGCLIHAVNTLKEEEGFYPELVLTLESTSPFRSSSLIDRCIEVFDSTDADSVIGVVEEKGCLGKIKDGVFQFLFPGQPRRRQERKPLYKESSTIYATKTNILFKKKSVLGDNLYPLVVDKKEALDINTEFDFLLADKLMEIKKEGKDG